MQAAHSRCRLPAEICAACCVVMQARAESNMVCGTDRHTFCCPPARAESLLNCLQARAECLERFGPQAEEYTQAGRFLRFRKDEEGAISVLSFFNYVMRRNAMLQTVSVIWHDTQ